MRVSLPYPMCDTVLYFNKTLPLKENEERNIGSVNTFLLLLLFWVLFYFDSLGCTRLWALNSVPNDNLKHPFLLPLPPKS